MDSDDKLRDVEGRDFEVRGYQAVKDYSFYDLKTGLFVGRTFSTDVANPAALVANTAAGHGAIEGCHDHLSRRVDISTGEIVDYQPPRPSSDHEWNADVNRWRMSSAAQGILDAKQAAKSKITELRAAQHEHIVNLSIDNHDEDARNALRNLKTQIAELEQSI